MKVIHVITGLGQGGAEAMVEKLLAAGRRLDPEIVQSVVSLGQAGVVGTRLRRAGFEVQALGFERRLLSPHHVFGFVRLMHALRNSGADTVVQTWLWHADLLGGICARLGGNRKVVWNLRNSMPQLASTGRLSRATAAVCARVSRWLPARIVCNSEAALLAHTAVGYDASRCVVIPNGFDLQRFAPSTQAGERIRANWHARSGELFVGMVARIDPQKDHATFIRAAHSVAAALPAVRFVLVGTGVTQEPALRTLLAQLFLESRFILEERREDMPDVMRALDVFCLASRSEGFPNVIGEAMACGTPTIATDAGDARGMIDDDRLVAAVGDADGLAACLLRVLSLSASERLALGLAQRQRIAQRFDIDQVWLGYRDLYRSLCQPGRR
jgi:glycosyltransferase involved in cell wall biosynthesis